MKYYGKVDLLEKTYYRLLRVDAEKGIGQSYAAATDTWKDSESAFEAPYDTTHYDELSESQAIEVKARLKAEYFNG